METKVACPHHIPEYHAGEIPSSLGRLSNLQTLALEHNKLTGEKPKQVDLCIYGSRTYTYIENN